MIFCETGGHDTTAFDNLVVFVSQLRGCGIPAVISAKSLPDDLRPSHQFDAAAFLSNVAMNSGDTLVLLDGHKIDVDGAAKLRELAKGAEINCLIYGNFETRQSEITASARVAYALNVQPKVIVPAGCDPLPPSNIAVFGAPLRQEKRVKPVVGLFAPDISTSDARAQLRTLAMSRAFDVEIITTGSAKKDWIEAEGHDIPAWHLGELLPRALAPRFDLVTMFGPPHVWLRTQMLLANLSLQGTPIIDTTPKQCWSSVCPDIVTGPSRVADLSAWLEKVILPKLSELRTATRESDLAKAFAIPEDLRELRPTVAKARKVSDQSSGPVLFMPTNGVGLGHAKRCSLIANAMRDQATSRFAAFPSCTGMLTASGFATMPLVSRSEHRAPHENDLVNFGRLSPLAKDSSAIVFDGGYVFDSVMRAAADHALPSIWIRRGLWQAGQNNQVALDRQKTFSRIVVPTEAFDELNGRRETAQNVHYVGPIVQESRQSASQTAKLRKKLAAKVGLTGKKLVVTMLGGGVAADRRAQINAICAHMETRSDVAHLLVVWPTATTDPGWFHYRNTRVVQSVHASVLIPIADLFISAIGYNSFHEAIYAHTPTIFVPQMAGFMDDQRARGLAAADRELALLIEPWEMLSLTKSIDDCLGDRGVQLRENLRKMNLPETGTKAAAGHILEYVA